MAAGIEVDCGLEVELCDDVVFGGHSCKSSDRNVEVVDVGLMVLRVVNFHDLTADVGFKCLPRFCQ